MAEFSVILEDVVFVDWKRTPPSILNRRVVSLEANDLDDAWVKARHIYYTLKTEPNAQIVDIKKGEYTLPLPVKQDASNENKS